MTIKRIDTIGEIEADGEVFDQGGSLGRAHLSGSMHQRVHDAGTQQDADAEVKGVVRTRAQISFSDASAVHRIAVACTNHAELTIQVDDGGQILFKILNTATGEIQITGVSD